MEKKSNVINETAQAVNVDANAVSISTKSSGLTSPVLVPTVPISCTQSKSTSICDNGK